MDSRISDQQRQLLLNHFARSLCVGLSHAFSIEAGDRPDAYRLRAAITDVKSTGRVGAAVSTAMGFGLPIGVRPPIGLGAFVAEMEVIDPREQQVAAMIWAQRADVASSGPRISRIGDAYDFAGGAADDFSGMFKSNAAGNVVGAVTGFDTRKRDAACAVYGKESRLLSTALGFIGIGVSPELTDRGAKKP